MKNFGPLSNTYRILGRIESDVDEGAEHNQRDDGRKSASRPRRSRSSGSRAAGPEMRQTQQTIFAKSPNHVAPRYGGETPVRNPKPR